MDKKYYFTEEKEINWNIIYDGLKQGLIVPYLDSDGLKARIGEYSFYFGGSEFEHTKPEDIDIEILKEEIKIALDGFNNNKFHDEYMYCFNYLIKNLQEDIVFENAPVYLVTYNNKGLSETNFIATKNDLIKDYGIDNFMLPTKAEPSCTYYVSGNKSYDIFLCRSIQEMADFLSGKTNTDIDEVIALNFAEGEYDGSYDDWYWCNEPEWCGKEALDIAKLYVLNTDNREQQRTILMESGIISVERKWPSVTQGEAVVVIDGKPVAHFADKMWLQSEDKTYYTDGHVCKDAEDVKFFKENADGWGSLNPDYIYVDTALERYRNEIEAALKESLKKPTLDEKINTANKKQDISPGIDNKQYDFEQNK